MGRSKGKRREREMNREKVRLLILDAVTSSAQFGLGGNAGHRTNVRTDINFAFVGCGDDIIY